MFITRTHLCCSVILMGTRTPSALHDLDLRPVTISGHQSWATENMPHLVLFLQGVGTVPRQLYVTFLICKRHSLIAEVLPLTLVMLIIMLHNHKLKTLVTWFSVRLSQESDPDHTSGHSIQLINCKDREPPLLFPAFQSERTSNTIYALRTSTKFVSYEICVHRNNVTYSTQKPTGWTGWKDDEWSWW